MCYSPELLDRLAVLGAYVIAGGGLFWTVKQFKALREDREKDFGRTFKILRVLIYTDRGRLDLDLSNQNHQKNLDIYKVLIFYGDPTPLDLEYFEDPLEAYFKKGQTKTVGFKVSPGDYYKLSGKKVRVLIIDGYEQWTSEEFIFGHGVAYEKDYLSCCSFQSKPDKDE